MTEPEHHLSNLAALGDTGFCFTSRDDVARFETPARGEAGMAVCVLRPRTTTEVSATIGYCMRASLPVVIQSGNTGLVGDSTPPPHTPSIILSMERMRKTFHINCVNRSLRASAGFRLSEINERAADHGLWLPIDLSSDPMAGGMVATNAGGTRFIRFGGVRQHVLGLTVVLADNQGTIVKLGCALRKDNSGPDLKHLFIGGGSTLGVITACDLNLEPRLIDTATALLRPTSGQSVELILDELERSLGPQLTAFESMSANALRHAVKHVPSLRVPNWLDDECDQILLVEIGRSWPRTSSSDSVDAALENVLIRLTEHIPPLIADAIIGRPEDLWTVRHSLSSGLQRAGPVFAFDLSFPRDRVHDFRREIKLLCATTFPDLQLCDFGHIGDGGLHLNFLATPDHPEQLQEKFSSLESLVLEICVNSYGGSFSAEHGVGRKNQHAYDHYKDPVQKSISKRICQALTANQIGSFRPGK